MKKPDWMTDARVEECIELLEEPPVNGLKSKIYLCYDLARNREERQDMETCLLYAGISASGGFNLQSDYRDLRLGEDWDYAESSDERRIAFLRAILDTGRIPDAEQMPCFKRVYLGTCPD